MNLYFLSLVGQEGKRERMKEKQGKGYKVYLLPNGREHGLRIHDFYPGYHRNGKLLWCEGVDAILFLKMDIKIEVQSSSRNTYGMIVEIRDQNIWFRIESQYGFPPPAFLLEPRFPNVRGKNYFLRYLD